MNNDFLDIDLLTDYLDGKLDVKTMNRIEREALEDPFVAEALAGLSNSNRSVQSLSILQKQLAERIGEQQQHKKTAVITWQRLSIGATAAVLFVTVSIVFWMREENRRKQAVNAPVEVVIAPSKKAEGSVLMPTIGMKNYVLWLNKHNLLIGKGQAGKSVTLNFHIDSKGRPVDIHITSGLAEQYDQEAIRLIKEGPDWEAGADQSEVISLKVGF
ncbi:hypothetical protein [Pedobacter duraquae]|uniref:TonB-like protein n=1 Tax=Pedobacter duraquae TaxID=425511 RepID=A0A4R6IH46_9SPHI|nr:hypothetical protein [Pedobacter duraquae]TDO21474.1 hypothetical protein CLV32_2579 [Pedobacter duraquae]